MRDEQNRLLKINIIINPVTGTERNGTERNGTEWNRKLVPHNGTGFNPNYFEIILISRDNSVILNKTELSREKRVISRKQSYFEQN